MNASPSSTPTYCCADRTAVSSRNIFTTASFTKGLIFSSHSPGKSRAKGSSDSAHTRNAPESEPASSSPKPSSVPGSSASRYATLRHTASETHSAKDSGFGGAW